MLFQLIYVSSAIKTFTDEELDAILKSAVRHNITQDITGLLLYSDGNFMQVIEGEEPAIDETYGRICQDPRHHHIFLLTKEPIQQREYPHWRMGFHRIRPADEQLHPAYADFFKHGFDAGKIGATTGLANQVLRQFNQA